MPTVAHSARISSRDLNMGPFGVGFIMRYHSIQTAPGMRPLRGQKSLPYGEDDSAIHSSTSRVSSLTTLGSATAAFILCRSTNMPAALGSTGKVLRSGVGTSVDVARLAAVHATKPPCR